MDHNYLRIGPLPIVNWLAQHILDEIKIFYGFEVSKNDKHA
jgi:hypothetical protein